MQSNRFQYANNSNIIFNNPSLPQLNPVELGFFIPDNMRPVDEEIVKENLTQLLCYFIQPSILQRFSVESQIVWTVNNIKQQILQNGGHIYPKLVVNGIKDDDYDTYLEQHLVQDEPKPNLPQNNI